MRNNRCKPKNYYTVYDIHTGDMIVQGTANECAAELGMSTHSFYSLISYMRSCVESKYDIEVHNYKDNF